MATIVVVADGTPLLVSDSVDEAESKRNEAKESGKMARFTVESSNVAVDPQFIVLIMDGIE